ncbi:PREDICTED: nitric oxide synthase-interacting protein-like [Priapulus caudatus]|uniref:Nitric oxide synthase-interacting protein homolog n=1 Tax=Priapulus caudatus TaxID=37621 RepID=A0ABM1EWZ7_PRICU|nr:PREDICTED: nitric oxide synthase-interacting protein-like [Priapulus caudatus]XP_014676719.1 PREDICTED: nitric oxide synthase-interacting protein-like [Priapulus caudatus]XP_014676720.1 PREDICTED: nitric oxide synthase-interacting protein-like [Priapulus caudatus]
MTRHARNATAGTVYSYSERRKDSSAGGYGNQEKRLSKDSVKNFDCCCLSLQPCRTPLVSPDGYLFDKECVLEYIITQKKEIARKMKEYEKQSKKEATEMREIGQSEHRSKVEKFVAKEGSIMSKPLNPVKDGQPGASASSEASILEAEKKAKALPSFWVPSLTPAAKKTAVKKPDKTVYCPMTGKPLKLSSLAPVKFTLINDPDEKRSLITREAAYMCAVTHDVLGNSVPCAVLRPSGNIVTMECVEKLIKKDMIDPTNGAKLKENDIIPLQRGGTGFAGSGNQLKAKVQKASMVVA